MGKMLLERNGLYHIPLAQVSEMECFKPCCGFRIVGGDVTEEQLNCNNPRIPSALNNHTRVELKNDKIACLEFLQPKSLSKIELKILATSISELFSMAFWHSNDAKHHWQINKIRKRLLGLQLIIFAVTDSTKEPIGYALLDRVIIGDHMILFVDSMGILLEWQGCGLGTYMLLEALKWLPSSALAARTQNPAFVLMLQNLNPERLLPFTEYYERQEDLQLLELLKGKVTELKEVKNIDMKSAVFREAYREGRLGDYKIDLSNPKIRLIEQYFQKMGLNRDNGDAVIVLAKGIRVK